jgi:hypothetical protein
LTNALEDARVSLKHSLDQLQLEKAWIENLLNSVVEGLLAIDDKSASPLPVKQLSASSVSGLSMSWGGIWTRSSRRHPVKIYSVTSYLQLTRADAFQSRSDREVLLAVSASRLVPPDAGDASWRWLSAMSRMKTGFIA